MTQIGAVVGLLSGVAQFLGSYFQSGLQLFIATLVIVAGGLTLTFGVMRGWHAGQRKIALSINVIVIVVVFLLLLGGLGGAIGKGVGTLARPSPTTPTPTPEDLSYQLSASPVDPRTVNVTAQASGQPVPGLTYWFIVEVDYDNDYTEYYPRWRMTGRSKPFDVPIPGRADTAYARTGRVYSLDSIEDAQAQERLARQHSGVNDFFEKAPGQPVSKAVPLPYGP